MYNLTFKDGVKMEVDDFDYLNDLMNRIYKMNESEINYDKINKEIADRPFYFSKVNYKPYSLYTPGDITYKPIKSKPIIVEPDSDVDELLKMYPINEYNYNYDIKKNKVLISKRTICYDENLDLPLKVIKKESEFSSICNSLHKFKVYNKNSQTNILKRTSKEFGIDLFGKFIFDYSEFGDVT
jgi:hypothetical protein